MHCGGKELLEIVWHNVSMICMSTNNCFLYRPDEKAGRPCSLHVQWVYKWENVSLCVLQILDQQWKSGSMCIQLSPSSKREWKECLETSKTHKRDVRVGERTTRRIEHWNIRFASPQCTHLLCVCCFNLRPFLDINSSETHPDFLVHGAPLPPKGFSCFNSLTWPDSVLNTHSWEENRGKVSDQD